MVCTITGNFVGKLASDMREKSDAAGNTDIKLYLYSAVSDHQTCTKLQSDSLMPEGAYIRNLVNYRIGKHLSK